MYNYREQTLILQITHKDTLDSLSDISDSNFNYGLLILFGIIAIGLVLVYFFNRRKCKQYVINDGVNIKKSTSAESLFSSKVYDSTKQTQSGNGRKLVLGNSEIENLKKVEQVKREIRPETKKIREQGSIKIIEPIKAEKEEQSKEKYIGYKPINIFAQTEPFNYPYVIMPKPNSVIKFPRKGRIGRKGYKEEEFKKYIDKYFKESFQIFDDRFILVKNTTKPYEPDFTLIDEKNNINIFLDIEIDEPYEGLNDISRRRPTHYQQLDTNRNNAFKNRGWIVIRFAEIQVHQEPNSCCRFIADVLKSINPKYVVPANLTNIERLNSIRQWTKEEAENWSSVRYREEYLGIDNFGQSLTSDDMNNIQETKLGEKVEDIVEDDTVMSIETKTSTTNNKYDKIYIAINSGKYLSFKFENIQTVVKPIVVSDDRLMAFCYVKNRERDFTLHNINDLCLKDSYYTLRVAGPAIGLDQIAQAVNTAIVYHKLIRMKYTRSSWTNMIVDRETGELLIDRIEAEESVRTINDVQLSINALTQEQIEAYNLNSKYITAYCNKRDEQRTFRFDRIGEIEILNI